MRPGELRSVRLTECHLRAGLSLPAFLPGILFSLLDYEEDALVIKHAQETITSVLMEMAADNLSAWLSLCKKILTVDENNENILGWPNGLTIDFDVAPARLYFVDAQKDFIASCRLDGSDFRKVISSFETAHPFGVAVYKNFLVWNDWTRRSIYQVDKVKNRDDGDGVKVIKDNISGAMDLKIFSSRLLDKPQTYGCDSHLCTHVCINMPQDQGVGYRCLCPDGMKLDGDSGHTCQCPDGQTTKPNGACSTQKGMVRVVSFWGFS